VDSEDIPSFATPSDEMMTGRKFGRLSNHVHRYFFEPPLIRGQLRVSPAYRKWQRSSLANGPRQPISWHRWLCSSPDV